MNGTIIENGKQRRIRDCFAKYNNPDYLGKKYNRLTVIGFEHRGAHWWWKCECDCGNIKVVYPRKVLNGHTSSCGCIRKERVKSFTELYRTKHGDTGTRLHYIWSGMRSRCENPNNKDYHNYGERGISVCKEWDEYTNFKEWAINNGYTDDLSIERIDVNGNYCPENCTWIPLENQSLNTRASYRVMYHGQERVFGELIREKGLKYGPTYNRVKIHGWSVEKAIDFNPIYVGTDYRKNPYHSYKAATI